MLSHFRKFARSWITFQILPSFIFSSFVGWYTGTAGTVTLCLGGTGTGMHYGSVSGAGFESVSGAGFGSGFDMKWDKKGLKKSKMRVQISGI
jgi:hypothetical protein